MPDSNTCKEDANRRQAQQVGRGLTLKLQARAAAPHLSMRVCSAARRLQAIVRPGRCYTRRMRRPYSLLVTMLLFRIFPSRTRA